MNPTATSILPLRGVIFNMALANNLNFNTVEFDGIKIQVGLNRHYNDRLGV